MSRHAHCTYRHSLVTRVSHALNILCVAVLTMSGLQIFNAHPALYWGEASEFDRPLVSIDHGFTAEGRPVGVTSLFGARFNTTGVLGWSRQNGRPGPRAFPSWITLPGVQDLAAGRIWHFAAAWLFVANGLLYVGYSLLSRHLTRDLVPFADDWRQLTVTPPRWRLRLHRQDGQYNAVQKTLYLMVTFLLAPAAVLTGLTMSPAMAAAAPWLLDLFGGRQSARTIHFLAAWLIVLFVAVHVVMVVVSGVVNNVRAIVTGWYSLPAATSNL